MLKNRIDLVEIRKKLRLHDKDTGSAQIQICGQTYKINYLTQHLRQHKKDRVAKRGLQKLVDARKKSMAYLKKHNPDIHSRVSMELSLRK